jgi:RNA polymerase sigma-70 factor (ECF subfamily)
MFKPGDKLSGAQLEALSDDILFTRIAKGDRSAFDEFIRRYGDFLYASAMRLLNNPFDAQDVTQDVMVKIWQKAYLWQAEKGASVKTWVYRMTYNTAIDALRRRKNQVALADTLEAQDSADQFTIDRQRKDIVNQALNTLPERQKAALIFCHYQGLSHSEAAEVMGTTVKSIESLLIRARKQLKETLKTYQEVLV